jgi:hypothetical protein
MLIEIYPGVHLDPEATDYVEAGETLVRIYRRGMGNPMIVRVIGGKEAAVIAKEIVRKINVTLSHYRRKARQEVAR